ncbi:hypothetical protein ACLKMH_17870 [Psychromonas sp. KJ10-10]|uniref:hypothetical protein n=1 Tax=Psychromonas sp. KJ10-10 TaxID=3391823 RepID=UPI0039B4251F
MTIVNNTTFTTSPINVNKGTSTKNASSANVSEVTPVVKKTKSEQFSMVLSEKQKDSLHQSLGYDNPSPKQLGAVNAYVQVADRKNVTQ